MLGASVARLPHRTHTSRHLDCPSAQHHASSDPRPSFGLFGYLRSYVRIEGRSLAGPRRRCDWVRTCSRACAASTAGTALTPRVCDSAGSGIGRASSIVFAREGAKVLVVDIDQKAANETVRARVTPRCACCPRSLAHSLGAAGEPHPRQRRRRQCSGGRRHQGHRLPTNDRRGREGTRRRDRSYLPARTLSVRVVGARAARQPQGRVQQRWHLARRRRRCRQDYRGRVGLDNEGQRQGRVPGLQVRRACAAAQRRRLHHQHWYAVASIASHRIASHRIASHRIASHRIASHRIASAAARYLYLGLTCTRSCTRSTTTLLQHRSSRFSVLPRPRYAAAPRVVRAVAVVRLPNDLRAKQLAYTASKGAVLCTYQDSRQLYSISCAGADADVSPAPPCVHAAQP